MYLFMIIYMYSFVSIIYTYTSFTLYLLIYFIAFILIYLHLFSYLLFIYTCVFNYIFIFSLYTYL